jgi:hypothetical protein
LGSKLERRKAFISARVKSLWDYESVFGDKVEIVTIGPENTQLDGGALVDPKQFLGELVVHVDQVAAGHAQVAARHFQVGRGGRPASAIQFKLELRS